MRIRLAFKIVFYFCGTFLHELAHYFAALLLGRAKGFSVIPRIEGKSFVLGNVRSSVRYRFLTSFIAIAPLIWWGVLFMILLRLHIVYLNNNLPGISYGEVMKRLRSLSFSDIFFLWIFVQLFWAGHLSGQDVKNAFRGMVSVSGVIFLAIAGALFYLYRHSPKIF